MIGFRQDEAGVDVSLADGSMLRTAYLVSCDGGRGTVCRAVGIEFAGFDPSISFMIAEVAMSEAAPGGSWELPILGGVPAPSAVLVRPDGHVAWVGEVADASLLEAMTTWFGAAEGIRR